MQQCPEDIYKKYVVLLQEYTIYNFISQKEIQRTVQSFFVQVIAASKIKLFLNSSKQKSLYNSTFFLTLSDIDLILSQTDFTLFIRSVQWFEN